MTARASRSRVTRVELTAEQLLGSDLTPARPHRHRKNAPKTITIEQLLGPSLTIAGGSSSRSQTPARTSTRSPPPRSAPRPVPRPTTPRTTHNPNRERVTADEVLRTGIPLRSLQAAKARARTAQTTSLLADQQPSPPSGSSSSSQLPARRETPGRPRIVTAEELAGPGPGVGVGSSRRPRSAGGNAISVSLSTSNLRSAAESSRLARPSTAGASANGPTAHGGGGVSGTTSATTSGPNPSRGRGTRAGQVQRSNSQGSTRTLPMYTREPGESEVVISRGAEELEDEVPITVMTPVDEDDPSAANINAHSPPGSPARDTDDYRRLSPIAPIPIPIPASPVRTFSPPVPFMEEVPSYEYTMSMSTPDLHASMLASLPLHPADIPLPASPSLSPRSPALSIPGRSMPPSHSVPSSPGSAVDSSTPPSPIAEGAESPRRRFQFRSLFHAHPQAGGSRCRGATVSGLPTLSPSPEHPSASPPSPRPFVRSSPSASGSMLDLLSRSWSEHPISRQRA